ncbi:MAG: polymer-forming cytoskeletal protein [Pseudomonadales bacterium]
MGIFNSAKNDKAASGVTLIAPSTRMHGDLHFTEQLFVNGRVQGNVYAEPDSGATVVVSQQGSVAGEIRVPNVVINGTIEGDVYASGKLELAANARVKGNVYYKLIEMQLGATVEGQLVHEEVASGAPEEAVAGTEEAANDPEQPVAADAVATQV